MYLSSAKKQRTNRETTKKDALNTLIHLQILSIKSINRISYKGQTPKEINPTYGW